MSKRKKTTVDFEINKNIAKILVLHRIWNGLNQTKIAEDLGITFQQVQKYEKCMNRLTAEMLINICRIRSWDISIFMCKNPNDILTEWKQNVDQNIESPYQSRTERIDKKWEHIDEFGEINYYKKHNFQKGN